VVNQCNAENSSEWVDSSGLCSTAVQVVCSAEHNGNIL
jgi:hypothetical protein